MVRFGGYLCAQDGPGSDRIERWAGGFDQIPRVFPSAAHANICSMLDSNVKGAIAEQAIILAAVKLGVPVGKPVSEHGRADLVFDIGGRLWRVQCKWGRLSRTGDVVSAHVSTRSCVPHGYRR